MRTTNMKRWTAVIACAMAGMAAAQPVAPGSKSNLTNGQFLSEGTYIVSDNKAFFAIQQTDGNVCVYRGTGPNDNRGGVWCSMKTGGEGQYRLIQQTDGNLCTYKAGQQAAVWCHMGKGVGKEGSYVTYVQTDANLCTYPAGNVAAGKALWCSMATATPPPPPLAPSAVPAMVAAFAPLLRFDSGSANYSYPMSADEYYKKAILNPGGTTRFENRDVTTLAKGQIPIYYKVQQFGSQYRIRYWIFFGYQAPCFAGQGEHNGDWENVVVITKEGGGGVAAVMYGQHGGHYTRISGPRDAPCTPGGIGRCGGRGGFELAGTHPVAYVGRIAHGLFHDGSGSDLASIPGGICAYYGDPRDGRGPAFETWHKLVSLDGNDESWLARDRQGNFPWGLDGVNTHPTKETTPTAACTGTPLAAIENAGCWKSECLAGDDQASQDCLKECEHGYTNMGLTCSHLAGGFFPTSTYGRLNSGKHYGYSFTIPTQDAGLTRRRKDNSDWNLP